MRQQCGRCELLELPRVAFATDETVTFRLTVCIVSASIPVLEAPGLVVRKHPRVDVSVGQVQKETNLAEFANAVYDHDIACGVDLSFFSFHFMHAHINGADKRHDCGFESAEHPWRFGDTLTLVLNLEDLLGQGLRLRLRATTDIRLGPLQLELARTCELGECIMNLREHVLPACIHSESCEQDGWGDSVRTDTTNQVWKSPVVLIPISLMNNKECSGISSTSRGHAVADSFHYENAHVVSAHIALSFGVTKEPDMLIKLADKAERSLTEKLASPLKRFAGKPMKLAIAGCARCGEDCQKNCKGVGSGSSPEGPFRSSDKVLFWPPRPSPWSRWEEDKSDDVEV